MLQLDPMTLRLEEFQKRNNLEWLRLIFALQVVVGHASSHLQFQIPVFIGNFPGVPAFFFVSGLLVYRSWLNAPGRIYFENRFLRLFPGLVFVSLGAVAVLLTAKGWPDIGLNFSTYGIWFLSQITLGQAYNPEHFRDVGVGVINGSLWTLTTEILFYLLVPIIAWLDKRFRYGLVVLIALSYAIYIFGPIVWTEAIYRNKTFYSFIELTPLVWGWMFGFGIAAAKYFDILIRWLRFLPLAALPLVLMLYFGEGPVFGATGNRMGILYFASYVCLIFWLAFATPYFRLKFDLSYGIYIWHMPVINFLLLKAIHSMPIAIGLTFTIAMVSWLFVEKPALKLKRRSLYVVG
jgi:peptidoglycan/LPS O-acetylase OafA/YrhL